ncbi:MAG: hypothetical protein HUU30_17415 [Burkholderiaceae bacterium]|nr:hypothetical protein [Burkholderiaceae bacterium]
MSVHVQYRIYDLPWTAGEEAERRFRRILRNAFVVYLLVALVMGRLVAESGIPTAMWPMPPQEIIYALAGTTVVTRRELVAFTWLRNFDERYADAAIMHQLTGLRLAAELPGGKHAMHLALAVAAVVGIVGGMWALLHLYSTYGLASAITRQWPAKDVATMPWRFLQGLLDKPRALDLARVNGMAAGGLVMALLVFLRGRYASFPLHPIGYAVSANWAMQEQWFPFLVSWALKLAVVGQVAFLGALAAGLHLGGLTGAGWVVSGVTAVYFGWYFWCLATWPTDPAPVPAAPSAAGEGAA